MLGDRRQRRQAIVPLRGAYLRQARVQLLESELALGLRKGCGIHVDEDCGCVDERDDGFGCHSCGMCSQAALLW
jgi:hypothetical protein